VAGQIGPVIAYCITNLVLGCYEEVARVHIPVVLHHQIAAACPIHVTGVVHSSDQEIEQRVEIPHRDTTNIPRKPEIEDPAEEVAPETCRQSIRLKTSVLVVLDTGDVLMVLNPVSNKILVELLWTPCVKRVDQCQHVGFNTMPLQSMQSLQDFRVRAIPIWGQAVPVVHLGRAVQAYTQQEIEFLKVPRQWVVDQHTVGLNGIGDARTRSPPLHLELCDLLKEVQPHEQGLSALPRKAVLGLDRAHVRADHMFQGGIRHPVNWGIRV